MSEGETKDYTAKARLDKQVTDQDGHVSVEDAIFTRSEDDNTDRYNVDFDQSTAVGQGGREVLIEDTSGNAHAGQFPRVMFEDKVARPKKATWIGYREEMGGYREVPVVHNGWFRHSAVFGTTGYGKTTFLKNLMVQWAYAGWGFCFIDPNGDGVMDLLQEIPEYRLDDVIWIDPISEGQDKVVGINFLQPGKTDSEKQFEAEVEEIIEDLMNIVQDESYWGQLMDRVFRNISRGMIRSDKNYTLIDMYYVLLDEEYREEFVKDVDDPAVKTYTRKIAEEMDHDKLDALIGRLQKFVENRITREIIGHPESSVNIKNAVEEGKLILVRNSANTSEVRKMIAVGVIRRIWAAIRSREKIDKDKRTPYFLVVDEFDNIVSDDMNIEGILSEARKFRLSVTLSNQQPHQLPQDVQDAIMGNCDNLFAFNPKNPDDARLVMSRMGEKTKEDLLGLPRFEIYTKVIHSGKDQSDPMVVKTFADYPPLRSREEAIEAIEESLERYGTDRLDPVEAIKDLRLSSNVTADEEGELQASVGEGDNAVKIPEEEILTSIYVVRVRDYREQEYVPVEAVIDELEDRVGEEFHDTEPAQIIEEMSSTEEIDLRRQGEDLKIKLTQEGVEAVTGHETGGATGGNILHRYALHRSFDVFSAAKFQVEIPEQQEGMEQPDGIARIPIDMSATNPQEMREKMQYLQENYEEIASITDGRDLNLEAESETLTHPSKTLKNLKKAHQQGRKTVFVVPEEGDDITADPEKAARILLDPPMLKKIDNDGNRAFYTKNNILTVGGNDDVYAVRRQDEANQTIWWERGDDGRVVLRNQKSGEAIASFDDVEEAIDPDEEDVPAFYRYNQGSGKYKVYEWKDGERREAVYGSKEKFKDAWAPIYPPFVPELEFTTDTGQANIPTANDWEIVIFPAEDQDIPPQLFEVEMTDDGELRTDTSPLFGLDADFGDPFADQDDSSSGNAEASEGDDDSGTADDAVSNTEEETHTTPEGVPQSSEGDAEDSSHTIDEQQESAGPDLGNISTDELVFEDEASVEDDQESGNEHENTKESGTSEVERSDASSAETAPAAETNNAGSEQTSADEQQFSPLDRVGGGDNNTDTADGDSLGLDQPTETTPTQDPDGDFPMEVIEPDSINSVNHIPNESGSSSPHKAVCHTVLNGTIETATSRQEIDLCMKCARKAGLEIEET